ncbi:NAD(P)H-binding protein [Lysobacter sp. A286]
MTASRTALVAGYTGLVGRHLLAQLLAGRPYANIKYAHIKAVGRRAPPGDDARVEALVTELGDLAGMRERLAADDVFCCLGTTLRTAGSRAAFEHVDFDMVVDLARAARAAGARRFFLVSALAANANSRVFYNRIKGRAEAAVRAIGYETLHIVRPSLLLGERGESRPGEDFAQKLLPALGRLLVGPLAAYRAVPAEDVARALVELAAREQPGVTISTLPLR